MQQSQVPQEEYEQKESMQRNAENVEVAPITPATDRTIPYAFICPLTLDIMKEPVMDRDGHTYEKRAILEWLERGHEVCPLTRKPLRLSDLIPNRALQSRIEEWRLLRGNDPTEAEEDDEEEFDTPFFGIMNLPLEMQGKMLDMESAMHVRSLNDSEAPQWGVGTHRGLPIVFYYIPEDNRILDLIQDSAAQQRLSDECIAEERCLTVTYICLLSSLFLLFGIVIFILYQLLLESDGI